ncbi:MAG: tRNA glutamyl-Q(34) synthetase GluQRS, partial [Giesbergeria sp.]
GSLVAALGSWLDARAHGGQWLVRIEDVDAPRCSADAARTILEQLTLLGLHADAPVQWQSEHGAAYQLALDALLSTGLAYPCACSRADIAAAHEATGHRPTRHHPLAYPGTCRNGLHGRPARAWRFACEKYWSKWHLAQYNKALTATFSIANEQLHWTDRRLGAQTQKVPEAVGDFVLKRADGLWAYQLAVVVDDAAQGVTHVVRGEDLADNTPRQMLLQAALNVPTPRYLHTPLVLGPDGEKLSKQHGAPPLDTRDPLKALQSAANVLGLRISTASSVADALAQWVEAWRATYNGTL